MISIHTNLSSLTTQNTLNKTTNKLNQAIERMSTGYKINHAGDNAANYSITNDMTAKIGSYEVAEQNTAMGLDLVNTAQDSIALMQSHGSRIRSLITQALNGTYGSDSESAIAAEINARVAEINRIYNNTEYNQKSLFNNISYDIPEGLPVAVESGFIDETVNRVEYLDSQIASMTRVASVSTFASGETYSITTVEELEKLADYVNSGKTTAGRTFVLGADLDLSSVENWTPIGTGTSSNTKFRGTFNGNGHKIENLKINSPDSSYVGLFGAVLSGTIKNIDIENVDIKGANFVGGLAGNVSQGNISNCSVTGTTSGTAYVGGLTGRVISSCSVTNCYTRCDVAGSNEQIGGFIGTISNNCNVINCYSDGSVQGKFRTGGFVGIFKAGNSSISNCYSKGIVTGDDMIGGLCGIVGCGDTNNASLSINNTVSYSNVFGNTNTGSFIGAFQNKTIYPADYSGSHGSAFEYTGSLSISNSMCIESNEMAIIGGVYTCAYDNDGLTNFIKNDSYDLTSILSNIYAVHIDNISNSLQVGINGDDSSKISFDTNFQYSLGGIANGNTISSLGLSVIDNFMNTLSDKATQLGAVSNRLESALDTIQTSYDNLVSSRSTLRDADMGKVSSEFVRYQILQQAAATLMSTANQSPSIALQLL